MATAPYDPVYKILNSARFRLNDRMPSLFATSGKILDETQASTQQAFNNAYRRMQDALCDEGAERFESEIVITNIPSVTTQDPGILCSISWAAFFDGTSTLTTPVLPQNLILPLWMAERPTTPPSGPAYPFPPPDLPNMKQFIDGLPMGQKQQRNFGWEWKQDAIFFPGAIINVDFRIRFRAYLSDIVDTVATNVTTRWFNQPFPVMRSSDAMTWWVCAEFAAARAADGDATEQMMAAAAACTDRAMEATKLLANRDAMQMERADVRRIPYGGGSRGGGGGFRG